MNDHEPRNHNDTHVVEHNRILKALSVVHDARSSNDLRHQASRYLEQIRGNENSPEQGFALALAQDQTPIVRHYGLSLLDYTVRYKWAEYSREQNAAVRDWVLKIASGSSDKDPAYLTNKIAELWVEIAKRSWAVDWTNMDELLVRLWEGNTAQKLLVLNILETLSDEIFTTEDSVAVLRGSDLNRAYIEIFIPAHVLAEQYPTRETAISVRYGTDGWMSRLSDMIRECANQSHIDKSQESVTLRSLSVLKSSITWVIPKALIATQAVDRIRACLAASNMAIQLAALDTLFALYNRSRFSGDEFKDVVGPMFRHETINLLKQLYQWLVVDSSDIDDSRYLLLKRLSETVFNLGRLLAERPSYLPQGSDLDGFVELLMTVMKSESLQVSIPALHLWVKFLDSEVMSKTPAVQNAIPVLLETCSQRLIRYEALPQDSSHPSIVFLNEDIETMPERHAFLGNYARFCNQVVERVVQQQPIDALYHILGQADQVLAHLYDSEPPFNPSTYSKYSIPWLRLDSEFTVIEAALRGCLKWLMGAENESGEHQHEVMTSNLQVWCDRILGLTFEDPRIKERVIQLAVGFAVGPIRRDAQFAVRVFDHVLETRCPIFPECTAYTDAVNGLQVLATHQLQRLAIRFADHLASIYDVIERKVIAVSQEATSDEHSSARYKSVLFMIIHRATNIDPRLREERLQQLIQPIIERWQDGRLLKSLSSFDAFSQMLGLDSVQNYLVTHQIQLIGDWSSTSIDDEGKMLQGRMQTAIDALPLRPIKHIFAASVEKLEPSTQAYVTACHLWQKYMPILLPPLLQFLSYSHACYDPDNWKGIPPDGKHIIHRIFTDRFWQHGISQGTRDDFYASIGGTRATVEGFASSIRATIRLIRETGYRLLFYMSHMSEQFYDLHDLSEPLSRALFTDACALSPHQLTILIDTVRPLLESCPEKHQAHFLPPLISALFEQLDRKTSLEWERIEQKKAASSEEDDLATEMKDESVLRQLTLAAVMLVAALLEPSKTHAPINVKPKPNGLIAAQSQNSTRAFILQTPRVLKPLILFCTHALSMHDTRACSIIAKVLRTIIGDFAGETPLEGDVREFISTEVLKACITSLHDGYFVDMEKDFAQLIASIMTLYMPRTESPKHVMLSLPGMSSDKVDRAVRFLYKTQSNTRQQRAVVLDLLQGYRSVALRDQGKMPKPDPNKLRSAMQQKYMTADMEGIEIKDKEKEPDLGGVAEMFQ